MLSNLVYPKPLSTPSPPVMLTSLFTLYNFFFQFLHFFHILIINIFIIFILSRMMSPVNNFKYIPLYNRILPFEGNYFLYFSAFNIKNISLSGFLHITVISTIHYSDSLTKHSIIKFKMIRLLSNEIKLFLHNEFKSLFHQLILFIPTSLIFSFFFTNRFLLNQNRIKTIYFIHIFITDFLIILVFS